MEFGCVWVLSLLCVLFIFHTSFGIWSMEHGYSVAWLLAARCFWQWPCSAMMGKAPGQINAAKAGGASGRFCSRIWLLSATPATCILDFFKAFQRFCCRSFLFGRHLRDIFSIFLSGTPS